MKKEKNYRVTAEPSTNENPTSGKIKVKLNGSEKVIPAVIFSSEKAEKLLKLADEVSEQELEKE